MTITDEEIDRRLGEILHVWHTGRFGDEVVNMRMPPWQPSPRFNVGYTDEAPERAYGPVCYSGNTFAAFELGAEMERRGLSAEYASFVAILALADESDKHYYLLKPGNFRLPRTWEDLFKVAHARPRQRAEAALLTLREGRFPACNDTEMDAEPAPPEGYPEQRYYVDMNPDASYGVFDRETAEMVSTRFSYRADAYAKADTLNTGAPPPTGFTIVHDPTLTREAM